MLHDGVAAAVHRFQGIDYEWLVNWGDTSGASFSIGFDSSDRLVVAFHTSNGAPLLIEDTAVSSEPPSSSPPLYW